MSNKQQINYAYQIGFIGFPTHFEVSSVLPSLPDEIWDNIRDRLIALTDCSSLCLWSKNKYWPNKYPPRCFYIPLRMKERFFILHSILLVNKCWYNYVVEKFDWSYRGGYLFKLFVSRTSFFLQYHCSQLPMSIETLISLKSRCTKRLLKLDKESIQFSRLHSLIMSMRGEIIYSILRLKKYDLLYLYGHEKRAIQDVSFLVYKEKSVHFTYISWAYEHAISKRDIDLMWKLLKFYDYIVSKKFGRRWLLFRQDIMLSRVIVACVETWKYENEKTYREQKDQYKNNPVHFRWCTFPNVDYESVSSLRFVWCVISQWIKDEFISMKEGNAIKQVSVNLLVNFYSNLFENVLSYSSR